MVRRYPWSQAECMIDIFIGKAPDVNRHHDQAEVPVQKEIRELMQLARNIPEDRRKNTRDRRRQTDPDVVVDLSTRRERRRRVDRRQKQQFLLPAARKRERRRHRSDRRHLQKDGITVTLSSRRERRRIYDRRRPEPPEGIASNPAQADADEINATLESIKGLVRKLRTLL
jgi:hypothetical protein